MSEGIDPVQLEHRLTQMEGMIQNGFSGVNIRLDTLNGQVAKNTEFRTTMQVMAAETKGFAEGRTSLRKKDLAIVGALVTLMGFVLQYTPAIIDAMKR